VILGYGSCGTCPSCTQAHPYYCDQSWDVTFGGRRLDGSATLQDSSGTPLHAVLLCNACNRSRSLPCHHATGHTR
jgi:Zn-dependent alcohol dehydrogenase